MHDVSHKEGCGYIAKTDWKFQMHNRYWSDNNIYSKENGGKYEFLTEPEPNQMAMPLEQVCICRIAVNCQRYFVRN